MENKLMKISELPDLHKMEASAKELSSTYWTPEEKGEYKVGVVDSIKKEIYTNESGEDIELPCVIFIAQNEDGTFETIRNGSKRLVATIEHHIKEMNIEPLMTPVKITYMGKQKNKTNSFKSDAWSVRELFV